MMLFLFFIPISLFAEIDLSSLIDQPKIVKSFKRVEFTEFPGAYNPSLLQIDDGLLCIFRYQPNREDQPYYSEIGIVKLGMDLEPLSEPMLLKTRHALSQTPSQAEDARIFKYRNRLFLIYNDNTEVTHPSNEERRDIYIAEIMNEEHTYRLSFPLKLKYMPEYEKQLWQKNWIPFQYEDKLFCVYSLDPHRILEINLFNGNCCLHSETTHPIWEYGRMRGSSQALLVNGEYLAFFHSGMYTTSQASKGDTLWHYFMGAYTFSAAPPFPITKISRVPIVTDGFYTSSECEKRVIFPGGFAVCGDAIYLAYGKDDEEIGIATLDKAALLDSLLDLLRN